MNAYILRIQGSLLQFHAYKALTNWIMHVVTLLLKITYKACIKYKTLWNIRCSGSFRARCILHVSYKPSLSHLSLIILSKKNQLWNIFLTQQNCCMYGPNQ